MRAHEHLELVIEGKLSGGRRAVACSSGTAALHLAFEALALRPGSKVIVPDLTMIAVPRAVKMAGLEPVFVGCGEDLLMNADAVADAAESEDCTAVVIVSTYGRAPDRDRISDIALEGGLFVVEDLAEAHGVVPHKWTDAACWSFYKNKIVAGEEGGAVAFRERKWATTARQLRSHGFTGAHDFWHVPRGCNYRLADSLAEKVILSLFDMTANVERREYLASVLDTLCPDSWRMPGRVAPWVYDLRLRGLGLTLAQMNELISILRATGIEARHCFKPCSQQEEFRGCPVYGKTDPALWREVMYLPLDMPVAMAKCAISEIRRVLACTGSVAPPVA